MARAVTRVVLWRSLIDVIVEGKATTVMSGIRSRRHTGSLWATPSGSRWATVDTGQQRERGEASIGEDPERQPVVADDPHRSRRGGDPHQGQCAGGPVPARDAASRAQESRGGGGARDAPGGLPSPGRGHDVP